MNQSSAPDIATGRLSRALIDEAFGDLHPPLGRHQAQVAADRCYFCDDAPCVQACPTAIDIPEFIRRIQTGNIEGSASTILAANIMGGMCARVCPTETLCEQACVRNTAEDQPVQIGRLQRYATDPVIDGDVQLFRREPATGKRVAVVGSGPAGLACAHRLALQGHDVVVFDRNRKPGGLNEYGIAAYKTVDDFAAREVAYIVATGGFELRQQQTLGEDLTLADLRKQYDAVFLGIGLAGVNALQLDQESAAGVLDAVDYIATLRQSEDRSELPVARRVVVIGGGMTAIDIAVQKKHLGAEQVTLVYRGDRARMKASDWEQEHAQTHGVRIIYEAMPVGLVTEAGHIRAAEFERTRRASGGGLEGTGETFRVDADMVFKAIGQQLYEPSVRGDDVGPALEHGRIAVDADMRTSLGDVWAGGDCVYGVLDLTVAAVADGNKAAESIHHYLARGE